jgi:hypothetical protein
MLKTIIKLTSLSVFFVPTVAFAGEIGVSHSVSNSVRSGTGNLTVESVKNIQVDEKSISFSGQLSGAEYEYGEGVFSGAGGKSKVDGPDKDQGKGNDKEGSLSLALGGVLGSGEVGQLSASLAKRTLSSTETINTNLIENYSFSDSVFTQTSSTFSR